MLLSAKICVNLRPIKSKIKFARLQLEYWTTDVGHAVVVVSMADEQVHVHDPVMEKAPMSVSAISFEAAWTEMDYGYAVITPVSGER